MALLSVQSIIPAGIGPTYTAAAAGGDTVPFTPGVFLHVKNGGGASITVTLANPAGNQYGQVPLATIAVTVPAAGERMIELPGVLQDANGLINITYSGVTSVTVGAIAP